MINEVCGSGTTNTVKNLGRKQQCLEKPVKTTIVAKDDFTFADLTAFRTKSNWLTALAAKNIKVLPTIEGITANNTEPTVRTGRFTDTTLKDGVLGSTYRIDTAICTHEALKSLENSEYTRVFRVTTGGEVTCDVQDDGTVKGQSLNSLRVGFRTEATDDDVPFTNVDFKYASEFFDILIPNFEANELEDISDVTIEITSAAAGEIKFKTIDKCSNVTKTNFIAADFEVLDNTPSVFAVNFTAADSNDEYTITPNAGSFDNGFTVNLDGVITQVDKLFEGIAATVSGI